MSAGPRVGSLFAGFGGLDLAALAELGGVLAWHSEIEPAACRVLETRFPGVLNLGDVTAVDWDTVTPVDVLLGGFPCQDVSAAGRRAGLRPDSRSGLWTHMARAIHVLRPRLVVIENVRGLLSADADCDLEPCPWCVGDGEGRPLRALGAVLGDLAVLGYDAEWQGLRAADVGAPHGRFRVFIGAWPAADAAHLGHERGRRARHGRPGPAISDIAAPDPEGVGWGEGRPESARLVGGPDASVGGARAATDPDGDEREERDQRPAAGQPAPLRGDAAGRVLGAAAAAALCGGEPAPDADIEGPQGQRLDGQPGTSAVGDGAPALAWGGYESAIRRWERLLGRPAPAPTMTGTRGGQQLSPRFVEWMMGLPPGWVTDVPGLTRTDQLRLLGNGVVPQQAAEAFRRLLRSSEEAA